jgi:hypothetical protein
MLPSDLKFVTADELSHCTSTSIFSSVVDNIYRVQNMSSVSLLQFGTEMLFNKYF